MSAITTKQAVPSAPSQRMTVDEFEKADFYDDNQVELINGHVIRREAMKPSHVLATECLRRLLEPMLPAGWFLREDKPVRIPDFNEPLPDIAIVRGDYKVYARRHPAPDDVALLIEVSDTSLKDDRGDKRDNYALNKIPVYWIVNLIDNQVELYTAPTSGQYTRTDFALDQTVPVVIDGVQIGQIKVSDILA
jgi:hypothetical protein